MAVTARGIVDAKVPANQKFTFNNKSEINDYLNWYNAGSLANIGSKLGLKTTPGIYKNFYDYIDTGMKNAGSPKPDPKSSVTDITNVVTNPSKAADVPDSVVDNYADQFSALVDRIYDINEQNNARMVENAERQMRFQEQSQAKTMQFNSEQAKLDRDWQTWMSNTAHQREVDDLVAAGLNPVLSANGGAPVGSGASASVSAMSGSQADVDTSITNFLGNLAGAMASMHNADVSAKAALGSASIQAAAMQAVAKYNLFGNIGMSFLGPFFKSLFK